MTLVAAEFTGVKEGYGLGYIIMTARDIQRPDQILAGMLVIGVIGLLMRCTSAKGGNHGDSLEMKTQIRNEFRNAETKSNVRVPNDRNITPSPVPALRRETAPGAGG